jgi:2-dehydro-3-deoxyphosphogalactonate aldolase
MASDPTATDSTIEATADGVALVAILRGLEPARALDTGHVLHTAGIRVIEVPLNSPDPFTSIASLAAGFADCLVGAGTVLDKEAVKRTHAAGGRLIVAPNCDPDVIRSALDLGMEVLPGIATPTEAFAAIRAGATRLKIFPASAYGPRFLQAIRAVLPKGIRLYPVGGVGAADIAGWLAAGAAGFGFGSELFRPDYDVSEVGRRASQLVQAFQAARRQR